MKISIAAFLLGLGVITLPLPCRAVQERPEAGEFASLLLAPGEAPIEDDPAPVPHNPRWGAWKPEDPHTFTPKVVYTRVDGAHLGVRYGFNRTDRRITRIDAELGYALGRERLLWSTGVSQPLFGGQLMVGGGAHRLTRGFAFDDEIVGTFENTLAAFLVKEDYREYLEGTGGHVFVRWNATDKYALTTSWLAEEHRALDVTADWSLFDGARGQFRLNPEAREGMLRSLTATISHDSRPKDSDNGVPFIGEIRRSNRDWVRLSYETSGTDLGGDFDYALARLDARGYWKLSPEQFFSARLLAGREVRGELPVQRELYAGGISTLRAHPYKAYRGDRQFLFSAEYAVDLVRAAQGVVFTDIGRAWFDEQYPDGPRLPIDVGLGLQTRDERVRILLAKDTRDSDAPLFLTVRTRATF
jgi:hypothetical protein